MNSTFSKNRLPKRKSHLLAELTGRLKGGDNDTDQQFGPILDMDEEETL